MHLLLLPIIMLVLLFIVILTEEDQYEVMPNGGRYGLRSNFAPLATPETNTGTT